MRRIEQKRLKNEFRQASDYENGVVSKWWQGSRARQRTHKSRATGLRDFFAEKAQSRSNSGSISSGCNALSGEIPQILRTSNPLHLSGLGRLTRQPAFPARPKPLIFRGFAPVVQDL